MKEYKCGYCNSTNILLYRNYGWNNKLIVVCQDCTEICNKFLPDHIPIIQVNRYCEQINKKKGNWVW